MYPTWSVFRPRWFVGKSLWSFAHVERPDHVNRAGNTDQAARTCERFVYSIVKITIVWLSNGRHIFWRAAQGAQRFVGLFSWLCFSDADWLGRKTLVTWSQFARCICCHSLEKLPRKSQLETQFHNSTGRKKNQNIESLLTGKTLITSATKTLI